MPRKAVAKGGAAGSRSRTAKATAAKRKAKPAAAAPTSAGPKVRIRQVRSGIGHAETYRRTLRALGLRHHQDEVVLSDTSSVRGMLHKVRHLVRVTVEEA